MRHEFRSYQEVAMLVAFAIKTATACGAQTSGQVASDARATTADDTPASSGPAVSGVQTNEQGRIEKAFGEPAGLSDNATGEPAISFTLTNPRMSDTCSGFWKFEPDNGVYIMFDISITTSPTYSTAVTGPRNSKVVNLFDWALGPGGWSATNSDGTVNADLLSTAGLNCDEMNTDSFSGQLAPASNYVGSYALDVTPATSNIFLQLPRSNYAWEWDLPAELLGPINGPGGF